jgi:hypothetical protein
MELYKISSKFLDHDPKLDTDPYQYPKYFVNQDFWSVNNYLP